MKILTSKQIRDTDQFTIKNEPISSIDLMERASQAFVTKLLGLHPEKKLIYIFCGIGNNGGDGLAIARLLTQKDWTVRVSIIGNPDEGSNDFKQNLARLGTYQVLEDKSEFPEILTGSIIIDGIFGSGLSRPVEGLYKELIVFLNIQDSQRIAIDISSGLFADQPLPNDAIALEADYTISFQVPKLVFVLPDYANYVGNYRIVDIGLSQDFLQKQPTDFCLTEKEDVENLIPNRGTYAHKNSVGRLTIVAGSLGKMGAAVLCAKAAFRSGVGLVNVHAPRCGTNILQASIPEAMVSIDSGVNHVEGIPDTKDVVAIGPGLGTEKETVQAFQVLLESINRPLVVDADGINILAANKKLIDLLPEQSILTPHPGEFRRLVGEWSNDFEKIERLQAFCREYKLNTVLKGAHSAVCDTSGTIHFNSTGNPGLATAGSGDVLTGIIGAFLAQGLAPEESLKLGVYLHGLAGDEAVRAQEFQWIQASDIIDSIPKAALSISQ